MKRFALMFCLGLFSHVAFGQWPCVEGDCQNGIGKASNKRGLIYHGEFEGGKWNGYGLFIDNDGDLCEGMFSNGAAQGISACYYSKSDEYWYNEKSRGRRLGAGISYDPEGNVVKEGYYSKSGFKEQEVSRDSLFADLRTMRANAPKEVVEGLPPHMVTFKFESSTDEGLTFENGSLEWAKNECQGLGFTEASDGFGECVLTLLRAAEK